MSGKNLAVNTPVKINEHAIAIVCGMGEDNARHAAQLLVEQNITALVSWGTAGSLTDNVRSGDLILADSVVSESGESYHFDMAWNRQLAESLADKNLKIHHGKIAHAKNVLKTVKDKSDLNLVTHALAVDMESHSIAMIADKENLSCVSIRAVVDNASQNIPEAIIKNTDQFGRPALLSLFVSIVKQPGLISHLIQLGKGMNAATKTLTKVASSQLLFSGIH